MVEISSPFPALSLGLAWDWLREFPARNFDDYGPATRDEFIAEMAQREANGERTWGAYKDGLLCGIVGYLPVTGRYGCFHGICFTRSAWGRDTTMAAVSRVLRELFDSGVEKVAASFFADNPKIHRFLTDLGAIDEGYLRRQTARNGVPSDMRLVAIFADSFLPYQP